MLYISFFGQVLFKIKMFPLLKIVQLIFTQTIQTFGFQLNNLVIFKKCNFF